MRLTGTEYGVSLEKNQGKWKWLAEGKPWVVFKSIISLHFTTDKTVSLVNYVQLLCGTARKARQGSPCSASPDQGSTDPARGLASYRVLLHTDTIMCSVSKPLLSIY